MKRYKQLTREQRYQIYGLKQAVLNQWQIAEKTSDDKSTISREFGRNKGHQGWRPKQAQSLCDERRRTSFNGKRFQATGWVEVERLIRDDSSPEQAADRLALAREIVDQPRDHLPARLRRQTRGGRPAPAPARTQITAHLIKKHVIFVDYARTFNGREGRPDISDVCNCIKKINNYYLIRVKTDIVVATTTTFSAR